MKTGFGLITNLIISPKLPGMAWTPGTIPLDGIKSRWPFGLLVQMPKDYKVGIRKCDDPGPRMGYMEHGFAVIDNAKVLRGVF